MAVTRIKNNQITDATIDANAKLVDYSLTSTKIANNLVYGSSLTVSGNLTVNGTTTTIDTVNVAIQDPLLLLADNQTGSPALDIGFIGKRGTSNNIAFVWKESSTEFETVFTSSEVSNTTVTVTSFANLKTNNFVTVGNANIGTNLNVTGTSTFTGNITGNVNFSGNLAAGNISTPGQVQATGNITGGNVTTAGIANIGTLAVTGAATVGTTLGVTGNITGGNVTTTGIANIGTLAVTGAATVGTTLGVTGNITGGNLTTTGTANIGTLAVTGTSSHTGNATFGNLSATGVATVTGNITGGNLTTTGTANIGTLAVTGAATVGTTLGVTGNITGGNITTAGKTQTSSLEVTGDALVTGNLTVQGNLTYINIEDLRVQDPIIQLGGGANGNALVTNDGYDRGTLLTYYTTAQGNAFMGWDNSTGNMIIASNVSVANEVVTVNSYGTLQGGNLYFNNANVTANANIGNIGVSGLVTVTGNITGGNLTTTGIANIGTLAVTGAATVGTTLNVTGNANVGNLGTAGLITATGNITGGNLITAGLASIGTTLSVTGNANVGNLGTAGLITATGNITGGNLTTAGIANIGTLAVTGAATVGTTLGVTGNITGGNLITTGQANLGNIRISGDNITDTNGRVNFNTALGDVDFAVNGLTANVFYIDAGTNTASFGNATQTTNALVSFNSTNSILIPVGNTSQRPGTPVTGMMRFNTSTDSLEFYDADSWTSAGTTFTIVVSDQYTGNGSQTTFTLSQNSTTAATIVSINGVVQIPTTAYSVTGNSLVFTEAPLSTDVIDARILTTTTTVKALQNATGSAQVEALDGQANVQIVGNVIPSANVTYNLGSSTNAWKSLYVAGNTIYLGNLQLKQTDANTFTVYKADGVTQANIDAGAIDVSSITSGTSAIGIATTNGNAYVTVGGTANVLVVSTNSANVAGTINATGNITTSANLVATGNIIAGNFSAAGTVTLGNILNANANGVGNIGNATGYFNTIFAKATSAQYADLAEYYEADNTYEPGTVVMFGGSKEVTIAATGTNSVAGVISTNPSYIMNSGLEAEHVAVVALTGRVPTKVVGAVKKGDMMVSAGNGRACASASPQIGTVIGKALNDFDGTEGTIEVVVGRL